MKMKKFSTSINAIKEKMNQSGNLQKVFKKQVSVSIAIPAYNAEKNIGELLKVMLKQSQNKQKIKEILVYSDYSQDKTVDICRNLQKHDSRIKIFPGVKRGGLAKAFIFLTKQFKGDVLIILNDDILIKDMSFIDKLIMPFTTGTHIGLVSANPQPLPPKTFIQAAGVSTFRVYERMRYSLNSGNNKFSCDGKVLVMSKRYISRLKFPKNTAEMANVDAYLYFSCMNNGFTYHHVREAICYFLFPDNLHDYMSLYTRNNADAAILQKSFGSLIDKAYQKPFWPYMKSILVELVNNPLGSVYIFIIGVYCKIVKSKQVVSSLSPTWEVVKSTKTGFK